MSDVIELINAELPQYQCGRCDTPGCKPYAEAIVAGSPHNRCVPGGQDVSDKIASILSRDQLNLDQDFGPELTAQVARVIEEECIGCKKCIDACPVDAIVGAANLMHSVIEDICTGCELCIEPCPVDCIELLSIESKQSKIARDNSEKFFVLKNILNVGEENKKRLSKNIQLNYELGNIINDRLLNRGIDKQEALDSLQIEILESQKNEKLLNADEIEILISTIKH